MDTTTQALLTAFAIYMLVALAVWRSRALAEKWNLSLFGPFLLWRTRRGRDTIERLARHARALKAYGTISLGLVAFFSALVFSVLLWEAGIVFSIPLEAAPTPQMMIGFPGINPLIPVGYGLLALAGAIIVHELGHALLARSGGIPIKSVGMVFLVLPMGAFVEPDEEKLKAAPRRVRARMFAAGPASNLFTAAVCAALFSWVFFGAVEPVESGGVVVSGIEPGYPADRAGLKPWSLITEIEGQSVPKVRINSRDDFEAFMRATSTGEVVNITFYRGDAPGRASVQLADKYEFYAKRYPTYNNESYRGKGFLGVSTTAMSPSGFASYIHRPYGAVSGGVDFLGATVSYVALPISGLSPVPDGLASLYTIKGPMAALPPWLFWGLANLLYWLFWLNLMVGTFNTLPAIPLDGGYIFRDMVHGLLSRRRGWEKERVEGAVWRVSLGLSLLILVLIIWQVVGPRVGAMLR